MPETRHTQLISWLQDQGHNEEQIEQIMARVADYDQRTIHESVFDSIDSGALDIDSIIREALEHNDSETPDHREAEGNRNAE